MVTVALLANTLTALSSTAVKLTVNISSASTTMSFTKHMSAQTLVPAVSPGANPREAVVELKSAGATKKMPPHNYTSDSI